MRVNKQMNAAPRSESRIQQTETGDAGPGAYTPRKMTFSENLTMTIKILVGFGLLGVALWGISLWTEAR